MVDDPTQPHRSAESVFDLINTAEEALSVLADKLDTKQGHAISEDAIAGLEELRARLLARSTGR